MACGAGEDDEAHDTDGQDDALEDPRAQVARSYGLVVGSQDREHQDTDADHECRVEQHQRGAGDEQRGGAAAVTGVDDARRYEAAYAICQVARKEKDPNDSGGPTHAGVRANDWRGGRVVGGGCRVHARKWPWSVIQSANATSCVGSGWCPGAASGAMTTTTSHTTPDPRLIASNRGLPFSSLVASDHEGRDACYVADMPRQRSHQAHSSRKGPFSGGVHLSP